MRRNFFLVSGTVLWLLSAGAGIAALWQYSLSPGTRGEPPDHWPSSSASSLIRPHSGQATLVVVVHPHCTCSRATIGELAELMARTRTPLTAYVLFAKLAGFDDRWVETDLWRSANAIPGVVAIRDELGKESRRFGASTSGQTMLYGLDGNLVFSGGITSARGHFGDNAGLSAVISLVDSGSSDRTASPVFGCPVFDRESRCENGLAPCRSKDT